MASVDDLSPSFVITQFQTAKARFGIRRSFTCSGRQNEHRSCQLGSLWHLQESVGSPGSATSACCGATCARPSLCGVDPALGLGVYKPPFQKSNQASSQIRQSKIFQVKPQIKSQCRKIVKSSHKSNRVVQTFIKSNLKSSHQPTNFVKSNLKSNRSHKIFVKSNLKSPKKRIKSSLKSSLKSHKHVKKAVSTNGASYFTLQPKSLECVICWVLLNKLKELFFNLGGLNTPSGHDPIHTPKVIEFKVIKQASTSIILLYWKSFNSPKPW